MKVATPAESARTEDPGLSSAREAAEVLPAESVHRNEINIIYLYTILKVLSISIGRTFTIMCEV